MRTLTLNKLLLISLYYPILTLDLFSLYDHSHHFNVVAFRQDIFRQLLFLLFSFHLLPLLIIVNGIPLFVG